MEFQRRVFGHHAGKGDVTAAIHQRFQKQRRVVFVWQGVVAADNRAARKFQRRGVGGQRRADIGMGQRLALFAGLFSELGFGDLCHGLSVG